LARVAQRRETGPAIGALKPDGPFGDERLSNMAQQSRSIMALGN
jgi:hypothetical protein